MAAFPISQMGRVRLRKGSCVPKVTLSWEQSQDLNSGLPCSKACVLSLAPVAASTPSHPLSLPFILGHRTLQRQPATRCIPLLLGY